MTNTPVSWRHRIDLPGAGETSGFKMPAVDLTRARVPTSLAGETLLDIGCSDGGHSFLCERRGATVTGLDDQSSPRNEGRNNFELARDALGSSATYVHGRTVDFAESTDRTFDRILHFNVLYHVVSPTDEAQALRSLLRSGGTLHLKTRITSPLPTKVNQYMPLSLWRRQPATMQVLEDGLDGDPTCFYVPSVTGVETLLRQAGFRDVRTHGVRLDRAWFTATAP